MAFYISQFEGDGTYKCPFTPVGTEGFTIPGSAMIDLRPDGGKTLDGGGLNACIVYLPKANSFDKHLLKFGEDSSENVSNHIKRVLISRLKLSKGFFDVNRTDFLIANLLLNPPKNSWNPLVCGYDQILRIYLEKELLRIPRCLNMSDNKFMVTSKAFIAMIAAAIGFPIATIFTETFTVGDKDDDISADHTWVTDKAGGGSTEWDIRSNEVAVDLANMGNFVDEWAYVDTVPATNDLFAEWEFTADTGANIRSFGPAVRQATGSTETHYYWNARIDDGDFELAKNIAGSFTLLGTRFVSTPTVTDIWKCDASGTTISGYVNDTSQRSSTDTSITSGRVGLKSIAQSSSTGRINGDNFEGGDLSAANRRKQIL